MSNTVTIDYPRTRTGTHCPLCQRDDKDQGLFVCWDCYRAHGLRDHGLRRYIVAALEVSESNHARGTAYATNTQKEN